MLFSFDFVAFVVMQSNNVIKEFKDKSSYWK